MKTWKIVVKFVVWNTKDKKWTVKGTVICFGISWSQQFVENTVVYRLLAYVCSITMPSLIQPSYHETNSEFKMGGVTPSAIFTRWHPVTFTFLAPKRPSTWTSFQMERGSKGGCVCLAGTATKRLFPRNLCLSWTLEEACRMWWALHWRLMSLYCTYFCNKSLYIIFPVFIRITLVSPLNYYIYNKIMESKYVSYFEHKLTCSHWSKSIFPFSFLQLWSV